MKSANPEFQTEELPEDDRLQFGVGVCATEGVGVAAGAGVTAERAVAVEAVDDGHVIVIDVAGAGTWSQTPSRSAERPDCRGR